MSDFKDFYKKQLYEELKNEGVPLDILNKYVFLECIACTDNSSTYKAIHKVLKIKYILKIYNNTYQANEYKILSKLDHWGVPKIIDVVTKNDKTFVLEEYFDGKTLDTIINESKSFSQNKLLDIFLKLCHILSFIHSQHPSIIHRDIKPENVMVSHSGNVKLIDFGSARQAKNHQSTDTQLLGTQGYAAPEQYGFKQSDNRTDIYSLGVLINEVVDKFNISIESNLNKIISKCKEIDPDNRFNNVEAIISKINDIKKPFYKQKVFVVSMVAILLTLTIGFTIYSYRYPTDIYHFKSPIIAKAVSIQLNKKVKDITYEDLKNITKIRIWGENIVESNQNITWESNPGNYVSFIIIDNKRYSKRGPIDTVEDLKNMPSLHTLELVKQSITDLTPLKKLELVHLYLNDNHIEDISVLKEMTSLYTLEIGGNPVSDFSVISNFDYLGELDISDTKCINLSFLNNTTGLKLLIAKNLNIENINFVRSLYALEQLTFEHNKITDISSIKELNHLKHLNIAHNPIENISIINSMKSIKSVVIRDTKIDPNKIDKRIKILQD